MLSDDRRERELRYSKLNDMRRSGIITTVECPIHPGCGKSRSVELEVATYGRRACEGYLGAWIACADSMSAEKHGPYRPRAAEIRAWLDSH